MLVSVSLNCPQSLSPVATETICRPPELLLPHLWLYPLSNKGVFRADGTAPLPLACGGQMVLMTGSSCCYMSFSGTLSRREVRNQRELSEEGTPFGAGWADGSGRTSLPPS